MTTRTSATLSFSMFLVVVSSRCVVAEEPFDPQKFDITMGILTSPNKGMVHKEEAAARITAFVPETFAKQLVPVLDELYVVAEGNGNARQSFARAFAACGKVGIPSLIKWAGTPECVWGILALRNLREDLDGEVPTLISKVRMIYSDSESSPTVDRWAMAVINSFNFIEADPTIVIPFLYELLQTPNFDDSVKSARWQTYCFCAFTELKAIGTVDSCSLPDLMVFVKAYSNGSKGSERFITDVLQLISNGGASSSSVIPQLQAILAKRSTPIGIQVAVAEAIERISPTPFPQQSELDSCIMAILDPDSGVQTKIEAMRTLRFLQVGSRSAIVLPILDEMLNDGSGSALEISMTIATMGAAGMPVLAKHADVPDVKDGGLLELRSILNDPDRSKYSRQASLAAIGALLDEVAKIYDDGNASEASDAWAVHALEVVEGARPDPETIVPKVLKYLENPTYEGMKYNARWEKFASSAVKILHSQKNGTRDALPMLLKILDDAAGGKEVNDYSLMHDSILVLQDIGKDSSVGLKTFRSLAKSGRTSRRTSEELEKLIKSVR
jgi:hypothetical protein